MALYFYLAAYFYFLYKKIHIIIVTKNNRRLRKENKLMNNLTKKLILFDWGNVLLNSNSEKYTIYDARNDIALDLKPQNVEIFESMFNDKSFWTSSGTNLSSVITKYLKSSGCKCSVDDFKNCYLKHYRKVLWFLEMKNLIKKIAIDQRFCIGILSTLCEMDMELLRENLPLDKFNYRFFSFNLGIQKPDPQIYEIVETVTGHYGENILFIDDLKENINVAKSRGWKTLLSTGFDYEKIAIKCFSFMEMNYEEEQFFESLAYDNIMSFFG